MAVPTARRGAEPPIPAGASAEAAGRQSDPPGQSQAPIARGASAADFANIVRHLDEPGMNKGPLRALLGY